ncbi:hypothetical protein KC336_g22250, partial [Hortaea werneckii]
FTMSAVQVPSSSALRGGLALQPLEVATCPIREMAGVVNAEGFFNYVDDTTRDVFFLQLQHSRLYMVGWMTTVGLAPVVERHVFARWADHLIRHPGSDLTNRDIEFIVGPSMAVTRINITPEWYHLGATDELYADFYGVTGVNLWLKVNDISLIDFHPTYTNTNDGLRGIWLNIYTAMHNRTARLRLEDPELTRAKAAHSEDSDDPEPEYFIKRE